MWYGSPLLWLTLRNKSGWGGRSAIMLGMETRRCVVTVVGASLKETGGSDVGAAARHDYIIVSRASAGRRRCLFDDRHLRWSRLPSAGVLSENQQILPWRQNISTVFNPGLQCPLGRIFKGCILRCNDSDSNVGTGSAPALRHM